MALRVTISGPTELTHNGQGVFTAQVTDMETGQPPVGPLEYSWHAAAGRFIGATDGASVTYHAALTSNAAQTVTLTCEVTGEGNDNPTVSAPSLGAMRELGITGQRVNMFIPAAGDGANLYHHSSGDTLAAGSDADLTPSLRISRIRWNPAHYLVVNRSGPGAFRDFWDSTAQGALSAYLIIGSGAVFELPGTWIGRNVGNGYVRWHVPASAGDIIAALDGISAGDALLLGIADTDSIGLVEQTGRAEVALRVAGNTPPVVSIQAPARLNPGQSTRIDATITDPEGTAVTVLWKSTAGHFDRATVADPTFTAPDTPGRVTLTCTAIDAGGVSGRSTHVIGVNAPPGAVLTVPVRLEVGQQAPLSAVVTDPDSDPVTVVWALSAGLIDTPTALQAMITAPATPQVVTVSCTATDSEGLPTVETAEIEVVDNLPPQLSIVVPSVLEIGEFGRLTAVVGDPTGDAVTVVWEASDGVIGNSTGLETTIVASQVGLLTITCTATDARGAATTETAELTVRHPNRAPVVELNVPATAALGQTVDIVAVVTDPEGDDTEGEWESSGGSVADAESLSTTLMAPNETGVVAVSFEAMDEKGAQASETAYITVGDPKALFFTPAVQIEIEGVDITNRWIPDDGLTVGKSLDYPELLTFRSAGVSFMVDNVDGAFDYSTRNNFFVAQGRAAHGRGAKVLVRMGPSRGEMRAVFAGQIHEVQTSLRDTKARIQGVDLSVLLRRGTVENFGETLTRRITDFPGANRGYDALNPVFNFPLWGLPISRGSVVLQVIRPGGRRLPPGDGSESSSVNIVETVAVDGRLSAANAEIDYSRGLIRFEAPPADGADIVIDATWKQAYRYKRPDTLIRRLLENVGFHTKLGRSETVSVSDAVNRALVRHPTREVFSSHGRPYFEREGVTRWMVRDAGAQKWYMIQDTRFLAYDEAADEYTEVSTVPRDTTIVAIPTGDYGEYLPAEDVTVERTLTVHPSPSIGSFYSVPIGLAVGRERFYFIEYWLDVRSRTYFWTYRLFSTDMAGQRQEAPVIDLVERTTSADPWGRPHDVAYYDENIYVLDTSYFTSPPSNWNRLRIFNASTGAEVQTRNLRRNVWFLARPSAFTSPPYDRIAVTPERIVLGQSRNRTISFFRHSSVTEVGAERITLPVGVSLDGLSATADRLFVSDATANQIRVFTYAGVELGHLAIPTAPVTAAQMTITPTRLFMIDPSQPTTFALRAYSLAQALNYQSVVPFQFETVDFDSFYFLATNTIRGDITREAIFNQNQITKFVKSTKRWTVLLDRSRGQPQVAHPVNRITERGALADNRKAFRVVVRDGKTLIFYRRAVQTADVSRSSIAYYNETDDVLTDIHSEAHAGAVGMPMAMDFVLDERTDGVYVYSFVVRYAVSGSTFRGATLKVFRKRVEPAGTETTIFSETFAATSRSDEYPVGVSDVILAADREKFYFVLSYQPESTTAPGRAELCELSKDGTGQRRVLKRYTTPLLGARSPARLVSGPLTSMGTRYFYLEGGWPRRLSPSPVDRYDYPNAGGRLIEIQADGRITDQGVVWRSGSKRDAPDPESAIYDGWGLHNSIVSNMTADDRGNLHFIAGYGVPFRVGNNLPVAANTGAIPDPSNFVWLQWGRDLATKIPSFPTEGRGAWDLIQQLAQLVNWEIGLGPAERKVKAIQAAQPNISDWSGNAGFFFRPRTILPAQLRTAVQATGAVTTLAIRDSGLPAERAEFPTPTPQPNNAAAGESFGVLVDGEMFTYTGVSPDAEGRVLTGVVRAQHGSRAQAHGVGAAVYFVDAFVSGESEPVSGSLTASVDPSQMLVSMESRALDFVNLRNVVNVGYGDALYTATDADSIEENGEFAFNLGVSAPLLGRRDAAWAQIIGDGYLHALSGLREVLRFTVLFSPQMQPGQLVVVHQRERVRIEFKRFKVVQVQHQAHPRWRTLVTAVEVV